MAINVIDLLLIEATWYGRGHACQRRVEVRTGSCFCSCSGTINAAFPPSAQVSRLSHQPFSSSPWFSWIVSL